MQFGVWPMRMIAAIRRLTAHASMRVGVVLFATACGLAPGMAVCGADVLVITDHQHPIHETHGVRVIELDAPARIKAELSSKLPSDPAQAALIVQQRLSQGGRGLEQRFATAYQGVIDAWSLGIAKIPAIVVDRRYVIYGETDIPRALARVEEYRRRTKR
jgi:integrating conjugative element protein (TIGR03757 family)